MATYVALLRAVNVGGTGKLPMAELKALCEGLGLTDVRTYIQSGNAVFACDWGEARVKAALEAALSARMQNRADVLVRSAGEMAGILDRNPFARVRGNLVAVQFFDRPPAKEVLAAVAVPGHEEVRPSGREVFVHYPDGMGRSKLDLSKLGTSTARNLNTVAKLAAMAKAAES